MSDADERAKYGLKPEDPDWMLQVAKDNDQPDVSVRREPHHVLDDLQVGMVVEIHGDGIYEVKQVTGGGFIGLHMSDESDPEPTPTDFRATCYRNSDGVEWCGIPGLVILADPPAPPATDWLVPADTMEALREARLSGDDNALWRLADAVLDAARPQEEE